jgi:hypothetical protein
MGLMSYIHRQLLRRGLLSDILPDEVDLDSGDRSERETARTDIAKRAADERETSKEVAFAVRRLQELNRRNHYGESLRRAFGGR